MLIRSVFLFLISFQFHLSFGQLADSTMSKINLASSAEERVRIIIAEGSRLHESDPPKSVLYYQYALKDTTIIKSAYLLDSLYRFGAFSYGAMNDRSGSLACHLKRVGALIVTDSSSKSLASAYYETASVIKSQGNNDLALPYFMSSRDIADDVNYHTQRGQSIMAIAEIYFEQGDLDASLTMYAEAKEIFEVDGRFQFIIGFAKVKMAEIYSEKGDNEFALKEAEEALTYPDTSQWIYLDYSGEIYTTASRVFMTNNLNEKAIKQLRIAKEMFERHNKFFFLPETYKLLSEAYRTINADSAFLYLERYVTSNDSVINVKNNEQITGMRFAFEEEQRFKEIEFLEQEKVIIESNKNLAERESSRKSQLINGFILALILVVILLVIAIYSIRLAKRRARLMRLQKKMADQRSKEMQDSINYAERIQRAVIPEDRRFKEVIPESFVYYRPKETLSGDFYWAYDVLTQNNLNFKLFAVGDCTGHGVPGALLSVLGINYLNLGAVTPTINSPAEALNFLNSGIVNTFGHSSETIRDGMDLVMGAIDPLTMKLTYASAKSHLYVIRNQEITALKGDKKAIGNDTYLEDEFKYTNFTFQLEKNDMIYALSDGFQDQFGGPKGKKFKVGPLKKLLLQLEAKKLDEQKNELERVFNEWIGELEQVDDVTVMGIRI
ncbi:MAG: serine phosphatase RsbU (regulator of sigma subunit)/tetratricopeptide (TPR) repeat protein [Crocinitomix sp.]|jgi:serine phosphatase RsbU (regulator of sigma subunit)/tetratricopeptide (TPR) repeat protein